MITHRASFRGPKSALELLLPSGASHEAYPGLVARTTTLTAIERTLLVEAGAGSGKSSVMAGRVAVLFANGVEPKHIAAITFTELVASEPRARIERFSASLSKGEIPLDLQQAFLPDGVTETQKANLTRVCSAFDQLACTTIHGFAQALIKPYPMEAGIDPGADIVDPAEASCRALIDVVAFLVGSRLSISSPESRTLIAAVNFPRHQCCFTEKGTKRQLRNGTR
jgi:ATP-dependent exoDNAse (exonuclease V) beta subunit